MLEPIKSTKATTATQATEPSDAVRPISEQRPGGTLQDRLYRMPEIQGATKPAASTGNKRSLFQEYSIAKTLPAVPLAAADTTAAPGTFSSFANKYGTYADLMAGLTGFQKQPEPQQFISDKYGSSFIDAHLKSYADKYGMSKGTQFLESLYRADRLADARKSNPYYQPIMLKDMDEYYTDADALPFTKTDKTSDTGRTFSGRLGGMNIKLDRSEIDSLRRVAEDNMLGQSGYEELLDRAYKGKASAAMDAVAPKITAAISSPYEANWGELVDQLSFNTDFSIEGLEGLTEALAKRSSHPFSWAAGAIAPGVGKEAADAMNLNSPPGAAELGPVMAIASLVTSFLAQKKEAKWANARFSPIKNGRLAKSINDYSGSEKNNIQEIAEQAGITEQQMVDALGALQVTALHSTATDMQSVYERYSSEKGSDRALQFSDSGVTLSKTYNPYGGKNVQ